MFAGSGLLLTVSKNCVTIIYFNAVHCHLLYVNNLLNHVTWMSYSLAFRDSRRSETQINALHPFFQPPLHIYTEFWYETVESWRSPITQSDLIKWLLNARSEERKLLTLHFAHILCRTAPHKCGFLLMTDRSCQTLKYMCILNHTIKFKLNSRFE